MKIKHAIHNELRRELADPNCILLGEDVATPQGGAFGVTKGLIDEFPNQVLNTPISEQAITGLATGLALNGHKVILEIMMGDFLTLCLDQILNHMSKIPEMYGKQIDLPIVIRTPMGGRRGYGPTHSQSLERFFVGIPNIEVYAINRDIRSYKEIYKVGNKPKLVCEYKCMYEQEEYFGISALATTSLATVFTYGEMLRESMDAFDACIKKGFRFDVIGIEKLYPLDTSLLSKSVNRTRRLLTVEEGTPFASIGAEAIAQCAERGILKKAMRLGNDGIVPCSMKLENRVLPGRKDIIEAVKRLASE